ncbi:MAG TPA: PP2C family protein-serine/threonine phosphatase [Polyangiaceae bacterium]
MAHGVHQARLVSHGPSHRASESSGMLTSWDGAGFHVAAERRGVGGTGGGDFYTLAVRAPGHIGVVIGDTCGRGSDGEAQLSLILPKIHELALSGAPPAALLGELNRIVGATLPTDRFVTAAAFELDMRQGMLTVANAAHVPALLRARKGSDVAIVGQASGTPLGLWEDTLYVDEHSELYEGDLIVLMTDGVLEALEPDLVAMSTLKRLLDETMVAPDASRPSGSNRARTVHEALLRKFDDCTAGGRPDDMTLMVLQAIFEPIGSSFLDFARAG